MIIRYLFIFLIYFMFSPTEACEVIDDKGHKIKLQQPAKRIISLAPDLTENLFALGAGNRIVGVMRGSDYPPAAKKIPIVANYDSVDSESLLALHPDLIVAWADVRFIPQLKKLNIPVYLSHPEHVNDVPNTLRRLACLTDTQKTAEVVAAEYEQRYQKIQKKYADKKTLTVFYQIWSNPLITITKKSWISEVISLCGGKNIFAELKGIAPEVDTEAVLQANPDVIIGTEGSANWKQHWLAWKKQLSAVKNQDLFSVNPDIIERATPRLLEGTEELCIAMDGVRHRR